MFKFFVKNLHLTVPAGLLPNAKEEVAVEPEPPVVALLPPSRFQPPAELDPVKVRAFKEFRPTTRLDGKSVIGELHDIWFDPKYEDTVALYDFAVPDDDHHYHVDTARFEYVDGEMIECDRDNDYLSKSDYHLRRRKRTV
ncbi:MAG: hypothetical protein R3D70_05740 [Rhizobiaceae bacterium]